MKTRIYIDGFNFYYGCLKGTSYKWLDLERLFKNHLLPRSKTPKSKIAPLDGIKFATAEISHRVASDSNSVNDQRSYLQAISVSLASLKVIKGSFQDDTKSTLPLVEQNSNAKDKLPENCKKVQIWKLEEKQSDVNLAVEALHDALTDTELEQIIFVTNDTDLVPALKTIKNISSPPQGKPIIIGLITPTREPTDPQHRKTNASLEQYADWTINYIGNRELKESQLKIRITKGKTPAIKPISWFEYKNEVEQIINILASPEVLNSTLKAWRWLDEIKKPDPSLMLPNLVKKPIQLLDNLNDLNDVLIHVKAYANFTKTQ